jgi:LysR family transcriptional regulator of gallate degradation
VSRTLTLKALFVAAYLPPPDIVVETESTAFLMQMLVHSDSLTFTVSTTLQSSEAPGLVMLDVPDLTSRRAAGIVSRRDGWLLPAASALIGELEIGCAADPNN